ncbi:MAG: glutamine--fructose-6-phosphate aminotransferase [Roseiflexus castenholzii]|uniref:SIS domain-containing protein n=1 Tax=Roseiflexus castenholzii TaxID=120962 RepID=UPI000CB31F39|nr:MAG: glutamine--fructose-6-phosphate aminotransferase [Roseiflexus castenholzii]
MTPSILFQEISEQPEALRRLIDAESRHIISLARTLNARGHQYVVIAARGSSDNAARYAQYLMGATLGLPVALATPSLHTRYGAHLRFDGALVIGISQSGASPDICAVIDDARRAGAPTVAITNNPESPLAKAAEFTIPLHAGVERSIAATKTYTTQLAALALLTLSMANDYAGLATLATIPDAMEAALTLDSWMHGIAGDMAGATAAVTIGRGYHYATAWEIALKLKELTYIAAEPYSAADFQHGPIALVREDFPVILIATRGAVTDDLTTLTIRLRDLGAHLTAISDVPAILETANRPAPLPISVEERFAPITTIIAGQLLVFHLARARGLDPDNPRGLRKVTETR